MQTINIHGMARRNLKFELEKEKKYHIEKGRTKGRQEKAKKYMNSLHLFELIIGEKPTGIKRTIKGRDAKLANKMSVAKYIAKKVKSISRWKWIKDVAESE
jgi:hypothetical protein